MQVGFAALVRKGQVVFQFYGRRPEEPRSLVTHAQQGRLHALLLGRLSYRQELIGQLPVPAGSPVPATDAALALAAYQHWGRAGLDRLEGSFALVVWDGDNQVLLGSRDPFGGYPLFWTRHPEGLAFGTCLGPLLQLLPCRSLNLDYLAEFLALPTPAFQELPTPQCAYEGVQRVSPGSTVEARVSDGRVHEHRYWNWLERKVDPQTGRLEELGDLVGDALRRAVGEQLRGRVAAHCSGGMDSTAVALLARDGLRGAPGQPPVHAVSLVFDHVGGLSRETPYQESALGQPGLVPHRVPADDLLDYDCFADPPQHDEPFGALGCLGLQAKLVQVAAAAGADTLLTGLGADALIDQRPFHLADLLRRCRLWAAWRHARAWGRAGSQSAWYYLWNFGLAHCLPASWRAGLRPLWRGGFAAWRHQGPGTIPPWVRPAFARSHGLRGRALRHLRPSCRPTNLAMVLSMLQANNGDCTNWYAAAPLGLAHVHPFLDPRFVCLCLGIQARFRQEPGSQKPLLAHAMRDVLPEPIRNRRRKSHYNALSHSGLARNLPALEALIRQAPTDDLGVFDKEVLLQCLRQAALGFIPGAALDKLDLSLAWLKWFSLQDAWQRPLEPAAVLRLPTLAGSSRPGSSRFRQPAPLNKVLQ
jgi:asparagine synthase (glutamine-hydrolysing)